MTPLLLSPLVDRDGVMIEGSNGMPLAADDAGLVYTLRDDGEPEAMGALDQDGEGRVILVPLPISAMAGLGALDPQQKGHQLIRLASRRAHGRGRLAHWERTLARQRASGMAANHPEHSKALAKVERWKQRLALIQRDLERVNGDSLTGDDEMAGLGESWWTRNRTLIGDVATGTALIGSALTKGTSANPLIENTWNTVRGIFQPPGSTGTSPDPRPGPPGNPPPPVRPPPVPPPASGMSMATILLIAGIGLGAVFLLRRAKT